MSTLLCVGNFDRDTGYAWDTIRRVWGAVAHDLEPLGVRTLSVYRQPASGSGISGDRPIANIESGWRDEDDLGRICRAHSVDACWLTDTPVISRRYGALRRAGVRFLAVHERTSGERSAPRGLKRVLKRLLARRDGWTADRYIAISDYVRRRLLETACLPEAKVTRIYNAIDLDHWGAAVETGGVRSTLGLPPDARLIVGTCRAQRYKGVDTWIAAMARMPAEDASGHPIHAVFCGDGPDLDLFRRLVAEAGLVRRFHIQGVRADTRALIAASDIVVVPSRWQEGFGLTVVEGMAARRPVVASAVGAIPELIDDGRTGLLVPPGDPDALSGALRRALDDGALSATIAAAAGVEAERRFGLPRLSAELTALFARGLVLRP